MDDDQQGQADGEPTVELSGWDVHSETVDELLAALRSLLRDENDRASGLNSRGSALIGFIGVIVSLATAAGLASSGDVASLHSITRITVGILLASALLALFWAICVLAWRVLLPLPGETIHIDEAKQFPTFGFISRDPLATRGYLMHGYVASLETERAKNNSKAEALAKGYKIVILGLGLVAAAGIGATVDRYVARGAGSPECGEHRVLEFGENLGGDRACHEQGRSRGKGR